MKRNYWMDLFATLFAVFALTFTAAAAVEPGDVNIGLEPVADGLTAPVMATHAGDGSERLFVVDQAGMIRIVDDGVLLPTPFLDLSDEIVELNPAFDERGLLGLAFHPNYPENGRFFVRYSAPRAGSEGEPCFDAPRGCHREVLAEYRVSEEDPNVADPDGEILLAVDEPQFNHDSGHVAFGPDGLLYFTLGDGGGAHDGLADDPPSHGEMGNGQNIETILGSVLRIDVDSEPEDGRGYAIPESNPFAGQSRGAGEIYAYGFRNPYRFSFDRRTGQLFVADVGQNLFEEVDLVQRGGNYGWVTREGYECFDPFAPTTPPETCADTGPLSEPLLEPIAAYDHEEGIAIVGGHVYRGDDVPELQGKYVFGDFTQSFFPASGRLFYLDPSNLLRGATSASKVAAGGNDGLVVPKEPVRLTIFELQRNGTAAPLDQYLLGFGEDEQGELYVLTSENTGPSGATGRVWKITPAESGD
jgi:glucose/arabinose dehydrogenase